MLTRHIQEFLQVTPGPFPDFWVGPGDEATPQPQFSLLRNLEIECISYLHVNERIYHQMFENFVPDCIRSNLRGI